MYKSILFFILVSTSMYALQDLGTYGSTHSIKEKNFLDEIEEKSKDLNTSLIEKQFYEAKDKFMQVKKLVPTCKKTQKRLFEPTFVVPADVVMANGKVIAKAGTVMKTLEVMKRNNMTIDKYMMFIDAEDEVQVRLSYMYHKQGFVFVTNGSISEYEDNIKVQAYKADRQNIEKFGIKCSPSLAIQDGSALAIYEYNPEDLVQEEGQ